MRALIRFSITALSIALMVSLTLVASNRDVRAQQAAAPAPEEAKQIPLTEKQIDQFIAAQKDISAITDELPENAADKPDPQVMAQLDGVAKKYNFASFEEYNEVAGSIGLVMGGIDPQTKKYVGAEAVLKNEIDGVMTDQNISPEDKKEQLEQLDEEMKSVEPVKIPANIELVTKNLDKLSAAIPQGEEGQEDK